MASLKLLGDQVAVKVKPEEEKTESGILLPGTVKKERPKKGVVAYVGPGKEDKTMDVTVGDEVIFGGWSDPIEFESEDYYIMSIDDIKAIIVS